MKGENRMRFLHSNYIRRNIGQYITEICMFSAIDKSSIVARDIRIFAISLQNWPAVSKYSKSSIDNPASNVELVGLSISDRNSNFSTMIWPFS